MLKLKLQYFGQLMRRTDSLEETLMLGKIEGKRRREQERMIWFDRITNSTDMNLSKRQEIVEDQGAWCAGVDGVTKSWTQLSEWTAITLLTFTILLYIEFMSVHMMQESILSLSYQALGLYFTAGICSNVNGGAPWGEILKDNFESASLLWGLDHH